MSNQNNNDYSKKREKNNPGKPSYREFKVSATKTNPF